MAVATFSSSSRGSTMSDRPTILRQVNELAEHISEEKRVLVITTPGRRHLERLTAALPGRTFEVFDQARVHVPSDVVAAGHDAIAKARPTVLLTLGGGAATGLGKVLRKAHPALRLIAIPTTYSGSELTRIWGTTDAGTKTTGRDDSARPDIVVHDDAFVESLPLQVALPSLLNALAHPVSALSAGIDDEGARRSALLATQRITFATRQAIAHHGVADVRQDAFASVALAATVLDEQALGLHHKLAHALGGSHNLPHASLHAVLLPHTLASIQQMQPELFAAIAEAMALPDPAAFVHDTLTRVGAPTSLKALGLSLEQALAVCERVDAPELLLRNAWLGTRPSTQDRADIWGEQNVVISGDPAEAETLVLAIHGRGSNAARVVAQVRESIGHREDVAIIAPQALTDAWYSLPYSAPATELNGPLTDAIERVKAASAHMDATWPNKRRLLFGFSQGACLALEMVAKEAVIVDGVVALCGARPSDATDWPASLSETRVLLSIAHEDPWVDADDVVTTANGLREVGAVVTLLRRPGKKHVVTDRDRLEFRRLVGGEPETPRGFGNHHEGVVLAGVLPEDQTSPRHAPYGLYPEQINGTGFVAARHENLRTWLYRVRPAAQQGAFERRAHPTLTAALSDAPVINLEAWMPPALGESPRDFVDGLVTIGGAGHPGLRRGYALHTYDANRDMENRAFSSADGDLLIVPQTGGLTVLTEMGTLAAGPGQVLVMPRGLRFAVLLDDKHARGYIGEIYARHFMLPERGPIGSNGLADERHFVGPTPFYEDRLTPGFEILHKMGGELLVARQDHSPWDVVGWFGNYAPCTYDISKFSPVGNTRVDHGDPSVHTLLSAGLDEQGAHALDFVIFPARWDPTEHTFRPPFFHRNVTTEINGIVRDPTLGPPFAPGMVFVTPSMTPHGVRARSVDNYLAKSDAVADKPSRSSGAAFWFQFETALPFYPSVWAANASERQGSWPDIWGEHATRFEPFSRGEPT